MVVSPAHNTEPDIDAHAEIIQSRYLDDVTDVLSRRTCGAIVTAALQQARRLNCPVFVAAVELSRMRLIGQVHGQRAGDAVLRLAATRLQERLDNDVSIARLGDDAFLVATTAPSANAAARLAAGMLSVFDAPFPVDGGEFVLGGGVGYEVCGTDGIDAEALIRRARIAADRACRPGSRAVLCYSDEMGWLERSLLGLEQELAQALRRDELILHYQPQISATTGELIGCEALVRWPRSDGEIVPPAAFLGAAASAGLLGELGALVLRRAGVDIAAWHAQGLHVPRIAVNLAPVQLLDPGFPAQVAQIVAEAGLAAEMIELELTEHGILDDVEVAFHSAMALHDRGFRLVLDDFGTGQSSLTLLHRFPFDAVKIDRSFVAGMGTDDKADGIVRAIIALAGELGMDVIGEGVEMPVQRDRLAEYGCGGLQGYLFARPMPAARLAEDWLARAPG